MKKFFCIMPLQPTEHLHYEAVGNSRLETGVPTAFPILNAIYGYAESGETIRVIAVVIRRQECYDNLAVLERELHNLAEQRGFQYRIESVLIDEDESISTHVFAFQRLLDYVEDEDEMFACMTFGTKPTSTALMLAIHYAYAVKRNTSIRCIVYGQVIRPDVIDRSTWIGKIHDMTALIQLDELIHLLAQRKDPDPKKTIDMLFAL